MPKSKRRKPARRPARRPGASQQMASTTVEDLRSWAHARQDAGQDVRPTR